MSEVKFYVPDKWEVDKPISDVIQSMNEVDFHTSASCCGFNYENQGVKHHVNAYIKFFTETQHAIKLSDALGWKSGWNLNYWPGTDGKIWILDLELWDSSDKLPEEVDIQQAIGGCWDRLRDALVRL